MARQQNPTTPWLRKLSAKDRTEHYLVRNTKALLKLKRSGGHQLSVHLQASANAALKCIQLHVNESKRDLIERLLAQEAERLGPFRFEHEE